MVAERNRGRVKGGGKGGGGVCAGGGRGSWQKCLFEFTIKIGSIFSFSVNYQLSVLCGLYTFVLYLNYVAVQLLRLSEVLQIATSSVSFFFYLFTVHNSPLPIGFLPMFSSAYFKNR